MLNNPDIAESLVRENPDIATAIVAGMAKDSAKLVEEYPDIAVAMVARTLTGNVKDPAKLAKENPDAAKAMVAEMLKDPAKLVNEYPDLAEKLVAAEGPNLANRLQMLEYWHDFDKMAWFWWGAIIPAAIKKLSRDGQWKLTDFARISGLCAGYWMFIFVAHKFFRRGTSRLSRALLWVVGFTSLMLLQYISEEM
jgi:hypothetical protein